jgi:hypothetical protein
LEDLSLSLKNINVSPSNFSQLSRALMQNVRLRSLELSETLLVIGDSASLGAGWAPRPALHAIAGASEAAEPNPERELAREAGLRRPAAERAARLWEAAGPNSSCEPSHECNTVHMCNAH